MAPTQPPAQSRSMAHARSVHYSFVQLSLENLQGQSPAAMHMAAVQAAEELLVPLCPSNQALRLCHQLSGCFVCKHSYIALLRILWNRRNEHRAESLKSANCLFLNHSVGFDYARNKNACTQHAADAQTTCFSV